MDRQVIQNYRKLGSGITCEMQINISNKLSNKNHCVEMILKQQ